MDYKKLAHAGINIVFTLITIMVNLIGAMGILLAFKGLMRLWIWFIEYF
ncbi:hypothetical protein Ct9H90mP29_01680 [bacterium]|nr:MAG: hypothetical protein Ct9H90mP29_01680 [bacterium]